MLPLLILAVKCQSDDPLKTLSERHRLPFDLRVRAFVDKGTGYTVTGDAASAEAMTKYAPLWAKEWSKYSADLMSKVRVTKVVFAEKLALNGQIRAAVPAFDLDTMYYDPALGSYNSNYQRNVVHHEFFHMMDQRMKTMSHDPEWAKLNAEGFRYGSGGAKMRTSNAGVLTRDIPGFLTAYGTAAIEEDKAELYCHLLIDSKFVADQATKDPVLAKKIELLKKRMAAYATMFDEKFWPKP